MAKINRTDIYEKQTPVSSADYWIGTDGVTGKTKNFPASNVAGYVAEFLGLATEASTALISVQSIITSPGSAQFLNVLYRINGTQYLVEDQTIEVTEIEEEDGYRIDIVVGTSDGVLEIIEGEVEDNNPAQPAVPEGTVLVTVLNVYYDSISNETPVSGDYMLKPDESQFLIYGSGTIDSLQWNNKNTYRWIGKSDYILTVNSLNVDSSVSQYLYDGRLFTFVNGGPGTLNISHQGYTGTDAIPFYIQSGATITLESRHIAVFKYSATTARLELICASNGIGSATSSIASTGTGILYGFNLTNNGDGSFTYSKGACDIVDDHDPENVIEYPSITCDETTIDLSAADNRYWSYVDTNGDILTTTDDIETHSNYRVTQPLHRIVVRGGLISGVVPIGVYKNQLTAQIWDIFRAYGQAKRGLNLSVGTSNGKLTISAGEMYGPGIGREIDPLNPNELEFLYKEDATFRLIDKNNVQSADTTILDYANYDLNGVVTAIPGSNARAQIFVVFMFSNENIRILRGQQYYDNVEEAKASLGNYNPSYSTNLEDAMILGYYIISKDGTVLDVSTTNRFGGISGGTALDGPQGVESVTGTSVDNSDPLNPIIKAISQSSAEIVAVASGTNTYTATLSPAITSYTDGLEVNIKFTNANTAVSTLNLNSIGAKSITLNGSAIASGELLANNIRKLIYNATSDSFAIIGANANNKLNTGANTGLAGSSVRLAIINTDGTITTDVDLYYDISTNTIYIGQEGTTTGRINIVSNTFRLKVQENITSGNAFIEFNADQEQALQFVDTNGVNYGTFKSVSGEEGLILLQRLIISRSVFYEIQWEQAAITTTGAGVKVYGKDSLGSDLALDLDTDADTIQFEVSFMVKNSTAGQVISGRFKALAKRVSGTVTVTNTTPEIITDHSTYTAWSVGAEVSGTSIKFFYTPDASDTTSYTGAFTEIKYIKG